MIREAELSDFPALAAITSFYIATTAIHFGYDPVTGEELAALWQKSPRYPWFVAVEDGEVVGYAKAGVWRERAAYQWTPEVGVYVTAGSQRRGRGRALYAALFQELAVRGFRSAIAGITLPNAASVALHEACGFVHVGTVLDAGRKFDAWHDVGFWQKKLGTASTLST